MVAGAQQQPSTLPSRPAPCARVSTHELRPVACPCRQEHHSYVLQRVYYAERTGDSGYQNTLVLANVEVPRRETSERENLQRFDHARTPFPPIV